MSFSLIPQASCWLKASALIYRNQRPLLGLVRSSWKRVSTGRQHGVGHFVPFDRAKSWTRFAFYAPFLVINTQQTRTQMLCGKGYGALGLLDSWHEHVRNLISFSFMYISLSKKFLATRQTTGHANGSSSGCGAGSGTVIQCMPQLWPCDPVSRTLRRTWTWAKGQSR